MNKNNLDKNSISRKNLEGANIKLQSFPEFNIFSPLSFDNIKISLCMIVKNEEEMLSSCLESARPFTDEMIVVDTGSTDKTIEIAKSYGAKIFNYEWQDDFGKARSFSLSKATGDWILILDADEVLDSSSGWNIRKLIKKSEGKYSFSPRIINYGDEGSTETEHFHCRIFPNNQNLCYRGVIHEQLLHNDGTEPAIAKAPDIIIHHYGYRENHYKKRGKRERNLSLLRKQVKKDNKNPFHYYNLQTVHYKERDFKKSLSYFNSVIKYAKRYKTQLPYLPVSYVIATNSLMNLKKYGEAIKMAKKSINLSPNYSDAHYLLSVSHYKLKNYHEALKSCNNALNVKKDYSVLVSDKSTSGWKAYRLMGTIYFDMNKWDESLNSYLKGLKKNPEEVFLLARTAICYDMLNIKEKACEFYQKTIDTNSNSYDFYIMELADFLLRVKSKEKSLELLNTYIKRYPDDKLLFMAKAEVFRKAKNWPEAIRLYNHITLEENQRIKPYKKLIYLNRGICYYYINNRLEAEKNFKNAIELESDCIQSYVNLAYIYLDKKQFSDSIPLLLKAKKIDRENPEVLLALAEAKLGKSNEIEAFKLLKQIPPLSKDEFLKGIFLKTNYYIGIRDYENASSAITNLINVYPDEIESYYYMVKILIGKGEFEKALSMYDCLISLKPDDVNLLYQKGKLLIFLKKFNDARSFYLKALSIEPGNNNIKNALASIPAFSCETISAPD